MKNSTLSLSYVVDKVQLHWMLELLSGCTIKQSNLIKRSIGTNQGNQWPTASPGSHELPHLTLLIDQQNVNTWLCPLRFNKLEKVFDWKDTKSVLVWSTKRRRKIGRIRKIWEVPPSGRPTRSGTIVTETNKETTI